MDQWPKHTIWRCCCVSLQNCEASAPLTRLTWVKSGVIEDDIDGLWFNPKPHFLMIGHKLRNCLYLKFVLKSVAAVTPETSQNTAFWRPSTKWCEPSSTRWPKDNIGAFSRALPFDAFNTFVPWFWICREVIHAYPSMTQMNRAKGIQLQVFPVYV